VVLDPAAGSATVRIDGQLVLSVEGFDSTLVSGIEFARAGLVASQDEAAIDLHCTSTSAW
jgi:hypothetical protein